MERAEIEQKIREILSERLDLDIDSITLESSLNTDLGLNSFEAMEFVFYLEETYNIKVPDEDLPKLRVVKDIVEYLDLRFKSA